MKKNQIICWKSAKRVVLLSQKYLAKIKYKQMKSMKKPETGVSGQENQI
jgi:hypothetical protein